MAGFTTSIPRLITNAKTLTMITYVQHLKNQNEARQKDQQKLFDYYLGKETEIIGHIREAMSPTFDDNDLDEFIFDWVNITEKLINQTAVVYVEPAVRKIMINETANEGLTDYYNNLLLRVNEKDRIAHRYAKLAGISLSQAVFQKGKINYGIQPTWIYDISVSPNDPTEIEWVSYDKYFSDSGEDVLYKVFWSATENFRCEMLNIKDEIVTGDKKPIPTIDGNNGMVNPYGVVPFAKLLRRDEGVIWVTGQNDLVNANERINIMLTDLLNTDIILGSRGLPVFINTKLSGEIRWGIKHPLIVEGTGKAQENPASVDFKYPNPMIESVLKVIDWKLNMIAQAKGLNPSAFAQDVKAESGFAKIIDYLEQLELRRDDIEPCRVYEDERFEITKKINNYHAGTTDGSLYKLQQIPDDAYLSVDFAELDMPQTTAEEIQQKQWDLDNNIINILDVARESNPDLDDSQLENKLIKNLEINQKFIKLKTPPALQPFTAGATSTGTNTATIDNSQTI